MWNSIFTAITAVFRGVARYGQAFERSGDAIYIVADEAVETTGGWQQERRQQREKDLALLEAPQATQ